MERTIRDAPFREIAEPQTTVLQALNRRLEIDPTGPYLDFQGTTFSAAEVDAQATRLAHVLVEHGVEKGDRVATLLENGIEQVVSFFATLKLGAIQVPINTAYRGEFLRHQLADSGARIFIVQADLASRLSDLGAAIPRTLALCIVVDGSDDAIEHLPSLEWTAALDGATDDPIVTDDVGPSDVACLIYTAGTTGPSKGCMLPHNYVVALAQQIGRTLGRQPEDVLLTPLPLFHFNAISIAVVGTLISGGTAVIERKFSVSNFWPEVKRTQATIVTLLGPLAILVANAEDHPDQRQHRLQRCAASVPPAIGDLWEERFGCRPFSGGFGLTEAALLSCLSAGEPSRPGAVGRINGVEFDVRIVDDADLEVATGEVGEIVCRPTGPNLMFTGYWNQPAATLQAFRGLWFHTGDLGRVDDEGFLYFVDRKKDALRRRGENVSSFEMERVLLSHEGIQDGVVHAVPSPVGEDEVKVTAVLRDGAALSEEELCRWMAPQVPYFAIPRFIEFRSELPRNPVGRVLKYQLRDDGVTPTSWDRENAGVTFERR